MFTGQKVPQYAIDEIGGADEVDVYADKITCIQSWSNLTLTDAEVEDILQQAHGLYKNAMLEAMRRRR